MKSIHTDYDIALLEAQHESLLFMDSNIISTLQQNNLDIGSTRTRPPQAAFMSPEEDDFNSFSVALQSCGLPTEPTEYYKNISNFFDLLIRIIH